MPKILLAPGIGDIHWVMLKMESFVEHYCHGEMPEIWVWSEANSTRRAKGYIQRLPFVEWGGYFDAKDHHAFGSQVFVRGGPWMVKDWQGFDYFMAFNAPLGQGHSIKELLPKCKVNWDYKVELSNRDAAFGLDLRGKYGNYVGISFFGHSFYKEWLGHFSVVQIKELIQKIYNKGCEPILTGAPWDIPFMRQFDAAHVTNMVGKTDIGQLFGLMKCARAFVGFAAGNGMLAQHLGTKTFMLWHPRQWTPNFMTNWVDPKKNDLIYHGLDLRNPCTPYIMEHL